MLVLQCRSVISCWRALEGRLVIINARTMKSGYFFRQPVQFLYCNHKLKFDCLIIIKSKNNTYWIIMTEYASNHNTKLLLDLNSQQVVCNWQLCVRGLKQIWRSTDYISAELGLVPVRCKFQFKCRRAPSFLHCLCPALHNAAQFPLSSLYLSSEFE